MLQSKRHFYVAISVAACFLIVGCQRLTTANVSNDNTPPGFLSVNVSLETGTAPGATTVAVGPIDLAAASGEVIRTGVAPTIGTIRVVATAGDPQSGISNITINGTIQLHCGSPTGQTGAGTEEQLPFTPTFTPATPPSTPASLTAVSTPIAASRCPLPAPPGNTLSTLRGWVTVTATSGGGSTTTNRFTFNYTDF